MIREIKSSFCSELESLALQLTRPIDSPVPRQALEELVTVLASEYDNPELLVTILAKLSRKLTEPNIYTKLKTLYVLHQLVILSSNEVQMAIMQCMMSLRSENDGKVNDFFFSLESVEELSDAAINVAELETSEFTKEYAAYVLDVIDARGDKSDMTESVLDRTEVLFSLLAQGVSVENSCKDKIAGVVLKQCASAVVEERKWILKQLVKLYELGIPDANLEADVGGVLEEFEVKFKPRSSAGSGGKGTDLNAGKVETVKLEEPVIADGSVKKEEKKKPVIKEEEEEDDDDEDEDDDEDDDDEDDNEDDDEEEEEGSFAMSKEAKKKPTAKKTIKK